MISRLWRGCLDLLFFVLMIPCYCCMLVGFLAALPMEYNSGQEAACQILNYQFEGELIEVEFIDSPPLALFPGGASEWTTWVVLELDELQAREFEQTISTRTEWHKMPLPEELLVYGEDWLQPSTIIAGQEVREKLPIVNSHGYYFFQGDLEAGSFTIAIYDSETGRLYINSKDQ